MIRRSEFGQASRTHCSFEYFYIDTSPRESDSADQSNNATADNSHFEVFRRHTEVSALTGEAAGQTSSTGRRSRLYIVLAF
jgi:hypothetical protein